MLTQRGQWRSGARLSSEHGDEYRSCAASASCLSGSQLVAKPGSRVRMRAIGFSSDGERPNVLKRQPAVEVAKRHATIEQGQRNSAPVI